MLIFTDLTEKGKEPGLSELRPRTWKIRRKWLGKTLQGLELGTNIVEIY